MRITLIALACSAILFTAADAGSAPAPGPVHDTTRLLPAIDGREYHWSDGSWTSCRVLDETRFDLVESDAHWSTDDSIRVSVGDTGNLTLLDADDDGDGFLFLPAEMAEHSRYVRKTVVDEADRQSRRRVVVRHRGTREVDTPEGVAVAHRIEVRSVGSERGLLHLDLAKTANRRSRLGRWVTDRERNTFWLVDDVGPVRWKHAYAARFVGRERFDRRLVELR